MTSTYAHMYVHPYLYTYAPVHKSYMGTNGQNLLPVTGRKGHLVWPPRRAIRHLADNFSPLCVTPNLGHASETADP